VVRNAVKLGYPLYFAVKSVIDACDEFIISEGYSEDSTIDIVERLKAEFPGKIRLFREHWEPSKRGEMIAKVTNNAMSKCNCNWIYYVQADEIIHESNLSFIKSVPQRLGHHDLVSSVSKTMTRRFGYYNSVSFRFIHFRPTLSSEIIGPYSHAIRMVRNYTGHWRKILGSKRHDQTSGIPKPFSRLDPFKGFRGIYNAGDGWTFAGNVFPVLQADSLKPVFHVGYVNRDRNVVVRRLESHWQSLYPTIPAYKEAAEKIRAGEDISAWSEWSDREVKISPYTKRDYPKLLLEWADDEGLEYVR
jgi:glycosyltransferase involved in cell wall biosynthesis